MSKIPASEVREERIFPWKPQPNQTPRSAANLAMAKERLKLDLRGCGTPFGRSGGHFLTQRQMNRIRHAESVINSQVKRNLRAPRPLNDGDAYYDPQISREIGRGR